MSKKTQALRQVMSERGISADTLRSDKVKADYQIVRDWLDNLDNARDGRYRECKSILEAVDAYVDKYDFRLSILARILQSPPVSVSEQLTEVRQTRDQWQERSQKADEALADDADKTYRGLQRQFNHAEAQGREKDAHIELLKEQIATLSQSEVNG